MADTFASNTNRPVPTRFINHETKESYTGFPNIGNCPLENCFLCDAQFRTAFAQQKQQTHLYTAGLSVSEVRMILRCVIQRLTR